MMHVCLSLYDILVPPGHKRTKIHVYGYPLGLHYRPSYIINFHMQNFVHTNRFRCKSMHNGDCAHKRADMHDTNDNVMQ